MKHWIDPAPVTIPDDFKQTYDPLLAEMLARRGLHTLAEAQAFLDPAHYTPASPYDLPDMDKALERVERAIKNGETICIWGDFDVDGQTASALLTSALRRLGATVTHYIPNRETEGHGVHVPRLGALIEDGAGLILTCDTGIAAHAAVDYANAQGVDVVITDHHQLPAQLPAAYAAVNPQRLAEGHPSRTLPGVGAAYKLVEALYERAGRGGELPALLDLVALGIVADVAVQTGDTRYLLQRGLEVLRETERLGLQMMIEQAGITPGRLGADDIAFGLGPRLNALGRLDDANVAVELLTTSDPETAQILVNRVEALNNRRKMMSNQVHEAAISQVEQDRSLLDDNVLILSHPTWPGGIIGIVANRLVEQYNRPVILLTAGEDGRLRGSARSVAGCDITAAIAAHAALLHRYGGHTMAAGLSLPEENLPAFRRALSRTVGEILGQADTTPTLTVDAYVPLDQISLSLLETLQQLAPFGAGNPPLTLATRRVTLRDQRPMGRNDEHRRLTIEDENGTTHDVVWWQADFETLPKGRFDLAYTIHANEYQGKREVRLQYVDSRPVDEAPLEFAHRTDVEIIDHRETDTPPQLAGAVIWAEGRSTPEGSHPRDQLTPAEALVIWSAPPGPEELRAALETVNPGRVVLVGKLPGTDSVQAFLARFGGVVKHVLNRQQGKTTLMALAGAMAHRPGTILAGLEWLAVRGQISYAQDGDDLRLRISTIVTTPSKEEQQQTTVQLTTRLQETAAYRAYFRRAAPEQLTIM